MSDTQKAPATRDWWDENKATISSALKGDTKAQQALISGEAAVKAAQTQGQFDSYWRNAIDVGHKEAQKAGVSEKMTNGKTARQGL